MSIVARLWRRTPGKYFFLARKSKAGVWKDVPITRDEFHKIDEFVEEYSDENLYFCPHGFSHPRRLEKYAVTPQLLWADLDNVDPKKLNGTKPSVAWESSPGRYAGVWIVDRPTDKWLNKRLSYTLGADKGGWDLTQVLRIPGTTNYKYGKGVPGKKLWFNPEPINLEKLETHLRDDVDEHGAPGKTSSDAGAVFKKYMKRIPAKIRKLIMANKAVGDRSGVLWQMGFALIEAGLDRDEWLTLVGSTAWNKFKTRPHQLEREYEKILAQKLPGGKVASKNPPKKSSEPEDDDEEERPLNLMQSIQWVSDVEEQDIEWIIPGWLAARMITIIEGDPGIGKSWIALMMAICISEGKKFPTHNQYGVPSRALKGGVLYIDLENDLRSVTKKRLRWMGQTEEGGTRVAIFDRGMDLNDEESLEELRNFLRTFHGTPRQIRLICLDTVAAYLGDIDAHNSKDVAVFMSKLADIAREFDCAILLLRHLAKAAAGRSAISAGMGSMSFSGMARMIHRVAEHPVEQGVGVIKTIKSGISRKEPALKFELLEGKREGHEIPTFLAFQGFDTEVTDEQLGQIEKKKKEDPLTEAKVWLNGKLADGPCYVSELRDECEKRNKPFKWSTVEKAANELGIERKKVRGHQQWLKGKGQR